MAYLPQYKIEDYGVIINSSGSAVSNLTAFQSLITLVQNAGGGTILLPVGTIYINGILSISGSVNNVNIKGIGMDDSIIMQTTANTACFSINTWPTTGNFSQGMFFEKFMIQSQSQATTSNGTAVIFLSGQVWTFRDVRFHQWYTSVDIRGSLGHSSLWTLTRCLFSSCYNYGVHVGNATAADEGDWNITDCWFGANVTTNTSQAAIYWTGSGGGKINGTKIVGTPGVGVFQYGIYLNLTDGSTSDMQIYGNSIENCAISQLYGASTATAVMNNLSITGNEFAGSASTGAVIDISKFKGVSIVGNNLADFSSNQNREAVLLNNCNTSYVVGNSIFNYSTEVSFVSCSGPQISVQGKAQFGQGVTLSGLSTLDNFLNVTGSLPANPTSTAQGVAIEITSAGTSSTTLQLGTVIELLAGYTGNQLSEALSVNSYVAGTGSTFGPAAVNNSNIGLAASSRGTTASGANLAISGASFNGLKNVGVLGDATFSQVNSTSAQSIGVVGFALRANANAVEVGGYFGLHSAAPTYTSSALIADNGTEAVPIFIARDNGTPVVTIADGGATTFTQNVTAASYISNITKQAGAYTILATDYTVVATGTTATWTFPTGVTGKILNLVNHGSGAITLGTAVTTANATTTTTLAAGSNFQIQYDGTVWRKIN